MENSAKQRAEEIYSAYYIICSEYTEEIQCSIQAKRCAMIDINQQIELNNKLSHMPKTYAIWLYTDTFLRQVRSEIEKL